MNEFNFSEIMQDLEQQLQSSEVNHKRFESALNTYKELGFKLQKLLEYACRVSKGEDKEKLDKLYRVLTLRNASDLCDRLRDEGIRLRRSEVYGRFYDDDKESPRNIVFRILELTRLGKRSEVFHIILRELLNAKEKLSHSLIEAFNPVYSDEMFKVFIYSFLSGLLGQTKSKGEDQE